MAVHGVEQWERRGGFELMARQGNEERERGRERERKGSSSSSSSNSSSNSTATFEEEDRRMRALMYELAPRKERARERE